MRWFVARTFAGAEWQAHNGLLRRGIKSYYPRMLADARRGRWTQASIRPQFPTYIFAGLDYGESTQAITTTTGVRDLLRNGVDFIILRPGQMEEIRKSCTERYRESIPRLNAVHKWRVGDIVPVPYGPFAGIPVQIATIDKSGRVGASIGNLDVSFHVPAVHQSVRGSRGHA